MFVHIEEKLQDNSENQSLPVMEIFATIQGEGFHSGKASVFIRLAGCDMGCNWCDTRSSWDADNCHGQTVNEIVDQLEQWKLKDVIVSGGEPLKNNLDSLTNLLRQKGYKTYLETSGAAPLTGMWNWICLSPKRNNPPMPTLYKMADELKVVISQPDDLQWAESQALLTSLNCCKFLQPEWSVRKTIVPEIVSFILLNPSWMLSLQSHKYIGIP